MAPLVGVMVEYIPPVIGVVTPDAVNVLPTILPLLVGVPSVANVQVILAVVPIVNTNVAEPVPIALVAEMVTL